MKKASLVIAAALLALPLTARAGVLEDAVGGPEWLKYGFDERLRQEDVFYSPRGALTNTDYVYNRMRTRLFAGLTPVKEVEAYLRFTNEYRYYWEPRHNVHVLRDEVILDNGYLAIVKPADLPVSAKLGRQDLAYGEGFLILDGGPNDGSRTSYSDGGKFTLEAADSVFDALAFYNKGTQPFAIDEAKNFRMDDQEIGLYGLYATNATLLEKQKIEAYYLYKNGKKSVLTAAGTPKFPDNEIHILGARLSGDLTDELNYAGEAAVQLGEWGEEDQRAFGGYLWGTYKLPGCPLKSALTLGYTYLSGDDPDTDRHEGWDPILSRWPKWSELVLYTLIPENGVGYWTNLQILKLGYGMQPVEKLAINFNLQWWFAEENPFLATNPTFFSDGKTRGLNPQANIKYKFTDWLASAVIFEAFQPGSYYQDEVATQFFSRWEFMLTF